MKPLKFLGILCFFVHYYLFLAYAVLRNAFQYLWRLLAQKTTEKHHISPFEATHAQVFAGIGTDQPT